MGRTETAYTYNEWVKLVEKHGRRMLARYIKRKAVELLTLAGTLFACYLVGAFCYWVAYQSSII